MSIFAGWPPEAIASLVAAILAMIAAITVAFLQWRAGASSSQNDMHRLGWEQANLGQSQINDLRRLLHRGWTRETAALMACELLALHLPEDLSPQQERAVSRARELLEGALRHASEGGSE